MASVAAALQRLGEVTGLLELLVGQAERGGQVLQPRAVLSTAVHHPAGRRPGPGLAVARRPPADVLHVDHYQPKAAPPNVTVDG